VQLYSELSSEDRLKILHELKKNPMKLFPRVRKFDYHRSRNRTKHIKTKQANLVSKTRRLLSPTPFGEQALRFLPGFEIPLKTQEVTSKPHTLSTLAAPAIKPTIGVLAIQRICQRAHGDPIQRRKHDPRR